MVGVPHVDTSPGDEAVGRDEPAGEADLDGVAVDLAADLDLVAQRFGRNRVAVGVDRDERPHVVNPAHLDVVRVEPHPRQRDEEVALDRQPCRRRLTGCS